MNQVNEPNSWSSDVYACDDGSPSNDEAAGISAPKWLKKDRRPRSRFGNPRSVVFPKTELKLCTGNRFRSPLLL
ncbi:hypothetical protein KSP40_PGU000990 [Platanthera guangdongensis]|uniref:Uncharacterized protein n=1 Tax=Platanthera guangdongensis TaxID=2320717 RepID=A0ABR2MCB4_9ASPA